MSSLPIMAGSIESALAGLYRIEREIGRGGMAVVYLARDLNQDRLVAIKVLDPEHASSTLAERFQREVRTAGRLEHPHILPVFNSGQVGNLLYYVMPFVRGRSLSESIRDEGIIPEVEALRIAREVTEALRYAHGKGVVHRDVKPGNVLLGEGGHIYLADFGLATVVHSVANNRLTASGVALGSPHYMSPEQIDAGRTVDGKTDVYSLGCVLFEMLTGRPPFDAPSVDALLKRHLLDRAPSLRHLRPELSQDVDELVSAALEKQPAKRPDAEKFVTMLTDCARAARPSDRAASTVGSPDAGRPPRILVLPFAEPAPEGGQAVSMGIVDEIIRALSGLDELRVISRSASLLLKDKSFREIGDELKVDYIVEGSIRPTAEGVRVYAYLTRVSDHEVLWRDALTVSKEDLYKVDETIAQAILDALKVRITPSQQKRLAARPIPDIRAYEYYLRAKQQVFLFNKDALDRAVDYLNRGIAILGEENQHLIAAIGYVYWQYCNAGIDPRPIHLEKARECADRLLELDPDSPDGYRLRGLVSAHTPGEMPMAIRDLRTALATNPNDTDSLFWLTLIYGFVGRSSSAAPLKERLLDLDPLTPVHRILPGFIAAMDGDLEGACPLLRSAYEADDETIAIIGFVLGQVQAMAGRRDEARETLTRLVERERKTAENEETTFFEALSNAYLAALAGEREKTIAVIDSVVEACRTDLQWSWSLAECYALVGETQRSIQWLENAVKLGFLNYPLFAEAKRDPLLDGVRNEPAFQALLAETRRQWILFAE